VRVISRMNTITAIVASQMEMRILCFITSGLPSLTGTHRVRSSSVTFLLFPPLLQSHQDIDADSRRE
jgi:hypothetical protein